MSTGKRGQSVLEDLRLVTHIDQVSPLLRHRQGTTMSAHLNTTIWLYAFGIDTVREGEGGYWCRGVA